MGRISTILNDFLVYYSKMAIAGQPDYMLQYDSLLGEQKYGVS